MAVQMGSTDDGFWDIEVFLDGRSVHSGGGKPWLWQAGDDEDVLVASLADYLRESVLDEEIWGGWPTCPEHGTHPLESNLLPDAHTAARVCPRGGRVVARIGYLSGR
jgi:hypothetical protein